MKAYYERRHIYEEEWRKKHPDQWTLESKRQEKIKKRVDQQYQYIMNHGDRSMTDMLNWLLQELSNSTTSLQYVFDAKSPLQPEADLKLTEQELGKIRLTDGGHEGSRMVFAAGDGKVLLPKWPVGLRGHECDAARDNFDQARDAVVKDVHATHKVSSESQDQLIQAVNGLFVALDAAYPGNVRDDSSKFKDYWVAKGFTKSLLAAANRAIDVNDPSVFSDGLRFQGDSLFALVEHMHRNGLQVCPARARWRRNLQNRLHQPPPHVRRPRSGTACRQRATTQRGRERVRLGHARTTVKEVLDVRCLENVGMAVEILILSSARWNERIALDCRAFQVGCDPKCEVFFDPQHDPAAKGDRRSSVSKRAAGYVRCSGGDMWIGTQLALPGRLRPNFPAMSFAALTLGPEFSFSISSIVAEAKVITGQSTRQRSRPLYTSREEIGMGPSQAEPDASGLSTAAPVLTQCQTAAAEMPVVKRRDRNGSFGSRAVWRLAS